jgi:acetyl-CoA carboxylase biotin carboxyl carrier protein
MTGSASRNAAIVRNAPEDGDTLVILESMKIKIPALAEEVGTLAKLHVAEGDVVQEGDLIATIS